MIMERVKEKANDYARTRLCRTCDKCIDPRCFGCYNEAKQSFIVGYTEANKWISVKEELPPFEDVPINERTKYLVKICTGSISPKIDVRIGCLSNHRKWIGEMDWVTVTHWRPIN